MLQVERRPVIMEKEKAICFLCLKIGSKESIAQQFKLQNMQLTNILMFEIHPSHRTAQNYPLNSSR